jgi:proline dehydrogenase
MLRTFFVYLSKAAWARRIVTGWSLTRRMAGRFVAGDTLEEAVRAIQMLNARGIHATLDHLGEHTTTADEARQATADILTALDAIAANRLRANMSLKLTQIGLHVDPALCDENLLAIVRHAAQSGNFVRVDMEEAAVTTTTLDLVRQVRQAGLGNVGAVIQAYLFRSEADVHALLEQRIGVRLCKGAYKEPAQVAFPKKSDVDANYDRLTRLLFDGALRYGAPVSDDGKIPPLPALATHDERRIEYARSYAKTIGLPAKHFEFQMLYGIRRDLQEQLVAAGNPVRVYVPYGTEWYPYFMRRLGERPANIWFIVTNFFRK